MFGFTKLYTKVVTLFVSLALCLTLATEAYAVPAIQKLVKVVQEDGSTLSVRIHGDEHFNWKTTEDGYAVAEKSGYFYYANYQADGKLEVSNQRVVINGRKQTPTSAIKKAQMGAIATNVMKTKRAEASSDSDDNLLGSTFPSHGDIKSVVILVEYYDVKFTVENPNQAFTNQLNQEGYSVEGAVGSARDYFYANSNGEFRGQFDVYGPYQLSQPQRYYGGNSSAGGDLRGPEMIEEAVELADRDGVDFSQYDFDGDGFIDNVFVYYAGRSEAEGGGADCVWPHKWNVTNKPVFDGKKLDVYACTSELRGSSAEEPIICGIGTFCHEFSHVFGLADHYDTSGSADGTSYGLGAYDIMTTGSYNNNGNTPPLHNALERMMIGWVEPEEIDSEGDITLAPINDGKVYKMSTDVEGEFFLFENRNRASSIWENYIPGEGLIISHVDQSEPYKPYWRSNRPNATPDHECFKFIVAGNVNLDYYSGWDKVPYPYKDLWFEANNNDEWSPNSNPKSTSWSGEVMPLQLTDIEKDGANINFKVSKATITPITGTVKNSYGDYVSSAMLTLTAEGGATSFSGMTDQSGVMSFFGAVIPNGTYTLTVKADGYSEYTKTFDLVQGIEVNVTLYSEEQATMREVKHHNGEFDHAVGSLYQFRPMAIITADMLKAHIGCALKEVRFYAAAPFQGQVIIQPGLYGGGWSPGPIDVTEADLGWYTVNFSGLDASGGDVIIQPNTDYYVKIMVMTATDPNPAIGMDNSTDASLYKYSSLVDQQGMSAQTIFENSGVSGNLLYSLCLSEESIYVAPTEFNTNPAYAEGIDLNVNESKSLVWAAVPANANPACDWTSSNESVVTVSGNGTLFGVGDGEATIIGTSVVDPSIKMEYTVDVKSREARAKGQVLNFKTNEGVSDVLLKFFQIENTPSETPSSSALAMLRSEDKFAVAPINARNLSMNSVVDEEEEYKTVTSGANGEYSIEGLTAGSNYMIVLDQDPIFDPWVSRSQLTSTPLVAYDANNADATTNNLNPFHLFANSLYGADRYTYFEGEPELNSVGDASAPMMYAIRIPASDLVDKIGHEITNSDAFVYNLADPYMEILIFSSVGDQTPVFEGGTAYGEVETIIVNGYHSFEFQNQDPIIVRPNTDYYAAVKMMGEMGAQSSADNGNDGYSNLIMTGKEFSSLTELGSDAKVDWQMSMYTKPREIDPVSRISISVDEAPFEPYVGAEYHLSATVTPATATYRDFVWSSSNEEVATIDADGNVVFLKEGSVTFYATSVKYPDVQGKLSTKVDLIQGTMGNVINSDGNRVAGAEVTFYATEASDVVSGAMQRVTYTRTSAAGVSVESDESGEFYIDLAPGIYEVEASHDGLMDYQGVVTIGYGMNETQVMMYQYIETLSDFMAYSAPEISGALGDESYNFIPYTYWTAEDLEGQVGKQITRLKALVIGGANIRFVIFPPDASTFIYRSELIEVPDATIEMVVHDIPSKYHIEIEEGKEYCIGYEVADYDKEAAPAVISTASPTIPGKSDCVVFRNQLTDLTTMYGESNGNWVLGFYVQDAEQIKGLDVTVGQHDAVVSWNPSTYEKFRVSYGVEGGSQKSITLTDCKYEFSDLDIATKYNFTVEAHEGGDSYVELFSSSFTTLDQKTTIPLAMLKAYDGYKAGEILNLKTLNTVSTDEVEWFVDGEKLPRNMMVLEAGKHKVQCRVTRGSQSFVTTRYISVE